jgi:septal ring factor EnvC (AmiA/AmiB activator)
MEKKSKKRLDWKKKLRFVAVDPADFKEYGSFTVSPGRFLTYLIGLIVLVAFGTFMLINYTPLRFLIEGYPDGTERQELIDIRQKTAKLEQEIKKYEKYSQSTLAVLKGRIPGDTTVQEVDTTIISGIDTILPTKEAQELIDEIESYSEFNQTDQSNKTLSFDQNFFTPVNGVVLNAFGTEKGGSGVDLIMGGKSLIHTILPGTVIEASWTVERGNTIVVQHSGNWLSVYSHLSQPLKRKGDRLYHGEAIARSGKNGNYPEENTIRLELWQNGKAVNPEWYLNF